MSQSVTSDASFTVLAYAVTLTMKTIVDEARLEYVVDTVERARVV